MSIWVNAALLVNIMQNLTQQILTNQKNKNKKNQHKKKLGNADGRPKHMDIR